MCPKRQLQNCVSDIGTFPLLANTPEWTCRYIALMLIALTSTFMLSGVVPGFFIYVNLKELNSKRRKRRDVMLRTFTHTFQAHPFPKAHMLYTVPTRETKRLHATNRDVISDTTDDYIYVTRPENVSHTPANTYTRQQRTLQA